MAKQAEDILGTKAKKYQTPQEKMKERAEAAKYGKAIAPEVSKNTAYKSVAEKVEEDPELEKFMNQVS